MGLIRMNGSPLPEGMVRLQSSDTWTGARVVIRGVTERGATGVVETVIFPAGIPGAEDGDIHPATRMLLMTINMKKKIPRLTIMGTPDFFGGDREVS